MYSDSYILTLIETNEVLAMVKLIVFSSYPLFNLVYSMRTLIINYLCLNTTHDIANTRGVQN